MEKPLITVIVPVYKVEKYLKRCVDSITAQTYKNLEIILVDDGSPDSCGDMCEAFAKEDSRIRVIHKENGGLSSARNAALDVMQGEYVGFVDSDDWIEPDMYEKLYSLLTENGTQIAAGGIQCDHFDGTYHFFNPEYPRSTAVEIYSKVQAIKELIIAHKITNSVCDKLFIREIFADMRFKEGIVNEDFEMMPTCFEQVEKVVYTPVAYYHYFMSEQSITRGVFKESRFTETDISRKHIQYYKEKYPELVSYAVAKHIEICLVLIHASSKAKEFASKRKELISEIKSFRMGSFFKLLDKKNKIKYLLFKINVGLYVFVMNIKG